MLLETLKLNSKLILLSKEKSDIVLYAATKQQVDYLEETVQSPNSTCDFIPMINMIGHISEVKHSDLKDIIKCIKVHEIKDFKDRGVTKIEKIDEFICYQENKNKSKNNNVITHECEVSSFKCACELLKTQYFIVLEEEKSWIKQQEEIALEQSRKDVEELFSITHKPLEQLINGIQGDDITIPKIEKDGDNSENRDS